MTNLTDNEKNLLAQQLEEIILENLDASGLLFETEKVKRVWEKKHKDVEFKTIFSLLFARNKIGMASQTHSEWRETWRTD